VKLLFFILLSLVAFVCCAEIFKSTDSQGNVIYSDTPMGAQSERVELPDQNAEPAPANVTTIPVVKNATPGEETSNLPPENKPYTKFTIVTPGNLSTLQNQPIIFVEVEVDPPLQKGDKIQIYLDGNPVTPAQDSTHFEFVRPDRGTHQLSAKLLDDKQRIINETSSYTIYVHQTHV
jgi:hypothetical protein